MRNCNCHFGNRHFDTALGYFCTGTFRHWCWKVDILTQGRLCTVPYSSAKTPMMRKYPSAETANCHNPCRKSMVPKSLLPKCQVPKWSKASRDKRRIRYFTYRHWSPHLHDVLYLQPSIARTILPKWATKNNNVKEERPKNLVQHSFLGIFAIKYASSTLMTALKRGKKYKRFS